MQVKKTIGAGLAATSVMTAYSYAVSARENKNFREPALLTQFAQGLIKDQHPFHKISGWSAHYTMGCVWAGVFGLWTSRLQRKPSLLHALAFGCFTGAVSIIIWRAMFRHLPHPPNNDRRKFYRHLFAAHILFAVSLSKSYALLKKQRAAASQYRQFKLR